MPTSFPKGWALFLEVVLNKQHTDKLKTRTENESKFYVRIDHFIFPEIFDEVNPHLIEALELIITARCKTKRKYHQMQILTN